MKNLRLNSFVAVILGVSSAPAFSAEKVPHFVDYYKLLSGGLGLSYDYAPLLASLFSLGLITFMGLRFNKALQAEGDASIPSTQISTRNFIEASMDFIYGLTEEQCGKNFKRFLPLMAGLFFFILISNISGLVPGLPPTTENFDTNLALGALVFLCYNYAGLKEHGASYVKQFTGPFLVLAFLFLPIEIISHSVRPLSLAFRLLANIFCDHLLLGVFSGLVPLVIPSLFLFFGTLVAFVQSFVFVLLTGIYINMAISHDH